MGKTHLIEIFEPDPADPLFAEHQAVLRWCTDALTSLPAGRLWQDVDLKSLPSGKKLLDADRESAGRYVLAAMLQVRHWDLVGNRIKATGSTTHERMNPHVLPGWSEAWGRHRKAVTVASALLRRALPFSKQELLTLLDCCATSGPVNSFGFPIAGITRALERYADQHDLEPDLRDAVREFAERLRAADEKDARRLATTLDQLCARGAAGNPPDPAAPLRPPPSPAPAGSPAVLTRLKVYLGLAEEDADSAVEEIGPDRFSLRRDSPLRAEHEALSALFEEALGTGEPYNPDLRTLASGKRILALDSRARGRILLAAAERDAFAVLTPTRSYDDPGFWQSRYAAAVTLLALAQLPFDLERDELFDFVLYRALRDRGDPEAEFLSQLEREVGAAPLTDGERYALHLWRTSLISGPPLGAVGETVARVGRWICDGAGFYLVPGEAWTDALNADLDRLPAEARRRWIELLRHLLTATSSRPSAKWTQTAKGFAEEIGLKAVRESLVRWLPLVSYGRSFKKIGSYAGDTRGASDTMHEENASALRGILWLVPLLPGQAELARLTTAVALSAYRKVPGVGPRAVKVGNAAIYALSELGSTDAVGQLAMLKVRVKFGTARKEIEKAFDAAARTLGLPRDQIEEMGVPSYGLEGVGTQEETIGGYRAELRVTGADAALRWFDGTGKPLKSTPAKVAREHKDELKDLQQAVTDIRAMLPAQRDRIDSLFLAEKTWPVREWRERYLDHPLVGTITRRLIWCIEGRPVTFIDGSAADLHGSPVRHGDAASIRLWHPVGRSAEEITGWRRRLRELEVTQPFKQAHREIYLLTDAERGTRTYSNRFAAHILRQHQFNALCAARGWKNKLRLMVDDTYPPATRELPAWGLRAEFWIEGVGGDHGRDTNDAGVFLRVATDQVRFYRTDAASNAAHAGGGGYATGAGGPGRENVNEPVPLEEIPPLVFSEIMREVEIFVGVESVGNDPAWQDGGPGGRYREYWAQFSFGELSATAQTRRDVLQQLVPMLKIAGRCSFEERFLVVRGDKRTYKIHLGSGNILMEPNDQYLCIVPDSSARSGNGLLLPFEGDAVLSIILSKALLLAEDTKIKDPSIVRQISEA